MERAILFRFHTDPDTCEQELRLLTHLNPETTIYGPGERIEGLERLVP